MLFKIAFGILSWVQLGLRKTASVNVESVVAKYLHKIFTFFTRKFSCNQNLILMNLIQKKLTKLVEVAKHSL